MKNLIAEYNAPFPWMIKHSNNVNTDVVEAHCYECAIDLVLCAIDLVLSFER